MQTSGIWIAWTTLPDAESARALATGAVGNRLAACAQVDGPIASTYRWEGKVCHDQEFRIAFKTLAETEPALRAWVKSRHPYATLQWICVPACAVDEAYAGWARACCTGGKPSDHA